MNLVEGMRYHFIHWDGCCGLLIRIRHVSLLLLHILIVQHREVTKFETHVRAVLASNPEGEVEVKVVAGEVVMVNIVAKKDIGNQFQG